MEAAHKFLSVCSGVQTLQTTTDIEPDLILPALAALKLRRLSAYLQFIFASPMPSPIPMLAPVTHLNIFDWFPSSPANVQFWLLFPPPTISVGSLTFLSLPM
ncbi:hypothetical protein MSAN_00556600 [Mycena sanguinolenta]|uniref:Uncharacterized protein n=1 Tax=Mycena sanguinolenta TaxID=230812 RepID=A0A8H6Z9J3_9AGAR|nr:hypothetical protein MSAN_00556600 [Mycena sanguinolenta]